MRFGYEQLELPSLLAYTAEGNVRSRRLMARLGMRHDAADDFDHPRLAEGHRLRPHVVYRLAAAEWRRDRGLGGRAAASPPSSEN